jgi:Uncharacterized alpha/beta hydrolase domain (DUF2235)
MARPTNFANKYVTLPFPRHHQPTLRHDPSEFECYQAPFYLKEGWPQNAAILLPGVHFISWSTFGPTKDCPQAGSGTYFQPGVVSPLFRITARILDEAVAWYLSEHIMNGYKFLMQNYHEGDTVCMFG